MCSRCWVCDSVCVLVHIPIVPRNIVTAFSGISDIFLRTSLLSVVFPISSCARHCFEMCFRCLPAYVKYDFFKMGEHCSVGREQDANIYWDDINVVLAGLLILLSCVCVLRCLLAHLCSQPVSSIVNL